MNVNTNDFSNYIKEEIKCLENLDETVLDEIVSQISDTVKCKNTIFTIGNGGSFSTASHMVTDFTKQGYNFQCLGDNIPSITAISNDMSYEDIFSYQLKMKSRPGDILIIFTGSGNSKNLINAINWAKDNSVYTIGITGYDGGKVKQLVDCSLHVNINDMQIAEDLHLAINHILLKKIINLNKRREEI